MSRVFRVSRCALLAIAAALAPTIIAAQNDNPFTSGDGDLLVQPELAPAELEPMPAISPSPTVDPAPAGEVALPEIAGNAVATPRELCRCVGEESSAHAAARIRSVLQSPLVDSGLKFDGVALSDVAAGIQEQYNIPVKLDQAALDNLGVQPDQPVTASFHGISLRSALRLILKELGLTYIIEDEVLMITTPDEAEQSLRICVYNVRDLIDPSKAAEMDALRDTILACIARETWAVSGGGEAEIKSLPSGLLVVSQTQAIQEELRDTLEAIRAQQAARPQTVSAGPAPQGPVVATNDDPKVVTRSYYLQINQQPGGESFAPTVRELVTSSLPDEQWDGRLGNGEPVVLKVLPDRVVLRHRQSVQNKVQSLLVDSGLISSPTPVAGETRGQGGPGSGGGGGFFSPKASEHQ